MNNIILITGPSGVGKTTLQEYLKDVMDIKPLVCATTRKRRSDDNKNEIRCITNEKFNELISKNKFFFHSGDYYKYGYFNPSDNDFVNSFVTSYRDLPKILLKDEYNIISIVLAFSNMKDNIRKRLKLRNENITNNDIDMRINFAIADYIKNFEFAKNTSDLLLYTDQVNIDEMCKITESKIMDKLKNQKTLILRR